MAVVFGIKSCDSCRSAMNWLEEHGVSATFHDFRVNGHDVAMLERWIDAIGWQTLLNKRSLTWRRIPEADRSDLNAERALALMLENPTLIKRPVLSKGKTVVAGFSPDVYARLFAKNLRERGLSAPSNRAG
ncbi:MAG: arsenate reductase [Woeseia sp.]|nr:arsenate reductase [Woeseia sp.]MBT8096529.1 arsenate reductase [Woeseia sp.]NNE61287.1 arsenate reductase [Woeseia sp.]NNL53732.1 arsenate reductase [Woeseia sp.]